MKIKRMFKKVGNVVLGWNYNEVGYWNRRYEPNAANVPTDKHIKYVSENIMGCSRILDFGPGVGRIFDAYRDVNEVVGYDISDKYKSRVLNKAREYPFIFDLIIFKKMPIELPFDDDYFDAAISVNVFLHLAT